jgi:protein-S-isoprenylcysteine O-methyltransferase Ste14
MANVNLKPMVYFSQFRDTAQTAANLFSDWNSWTAMNGIPKAVYLGLISSLLYAMSRNPNPLKSAATNKDTSQNEAPLPTSPDGALPTGVKKGAGDRIIPDEASKAFRKYTWPLMQAWNVLSTLYYLYHLYWLPTSFRLWRWSIFDMISAATTLGSILLRYWSINELGRLFTFDVAIREGHKLIDSGPYRFLLHPSYTGALGAVWSHALFLMGPIYHVFRNRVILGVLGAISWPIWGGATTLLLGLTGGLLYLMHRYIMQRMNVEEKALKEEFGEEWDRYVSGKKEVMEGEADKKKKRTDTGTDVGRGEGDVVGNGEKASVLKSKTVALPFGMKRRYRLIPFVY